MLKVNNENIIIWDLLPDCILDNIIFKNIFLSKSKFII